MNISKTPNFAKKIFQNTAFALIDTLFMKITTTIVFILLVRLLPKEDIAKIGVATGYVVLLTYFNIGAIRVLYRDYAKFDKNSNDLMQFLTAIFVSWFLQSIIMLICCQILQVFVFSGRNVHGLSFLFWGLTIEFIAFTFQEWIKVIFFTNFKQSIVTRLSFFLNLIRLASYGILLVWPSLENYSRILIVTSFANCIVWTTLFQRHFHFRPIVDRHLTIILLNCLKGYSLWDHFNRVVIDTLFTIDIVVLSWFGKFNDVANYTIALKFTSLFFLIPMQLGRSLQITLSNLMENQKRYEAINGFIKINAAISFAQMVFVIVFGGWVIQFLFGAGIDKDVWLYTIIISFGVTIMNLGYPLISVINTFCDLRKVFLMVFLPALFLGILLYIFSAFLWGGLGLSVGNIVIYSLIVCAISIYTIKYYRFPLELKLFTEKDKRLLQQVFKWGKLN
jgi:O-antigen/teichoic acid export membrane protein